MTVFIVNGKYLANQNSVHCYTTNKGTGGGQVADNVDERKAYVCRAETIKTRGHSEKQREGFQLS